MQPCFDARLAFRRTVRTLYSFYFLVPLRIVALAYAEPTEFEQDHFSVFVSVQKEGQSPALRACHVEPKRFAKQNAPGLPLITSFQRFYVPLVFHREANYVSLVTVCYRDVGSRLRDAI